MPSPSVLTRTEGSTLVITLNRSEKRNAIDPSMVKGLSKAVAELEGRSELRAAVLTGAGTTFSAGADLNYLAEGRADVLRTEAGGLGGFVHYPRTKPVIAAVNGAALAGGCEIALSCDVVVASRDAVFGLPEVLRGIAASAGGVFRWSRAIPFGRALYPLLSGEPISAEEAGRIGLIWACVEPDQVMSVALEACHRIQQAAPLAVAATLVGAREACGMSGTQDDWRSADSIARALAETHDAHEGAAAFLDRRSPQWTGS